MHTRCSDNIAERFENNQQLFSLLISLLVLTKKINDHSLLLEHGSADDDVLCLATDFKPTRDFGFTFLMLFLWDMTPG